MYDTSTYYDMGGSADSAFRQLLAVFVKKCEGRKNYSYDSAVILYPYYFDRS